MNRQFLAVAFKPGGRSYTYHNDGEPRALGDMVRVPARNGGEQSVEIIGIWPASEPAPPFETKEILGPAPRRMAEQFELKEE